MSLHAANQTSFKKGCIPHNKGQQTKKVLKKVELFLAKQAIECKVHGAHVKWLIHSGNNVKCKLCSAEQQKIARKNRPITFLLKDARGHAKSKNIAFELNEQDIIELIARQNNKCALSNVEFNSDIKFSLDRIDPKLGYIKTNVQLLIFEVNRMKTNLQQERFLELCNLIAGKSNKGKKK